MSRQHCDFPLHSHHELNKDQGRLEALLYLGPLDACWGAELTHLSPVSYCFVSLRRISAGVASRRDFTESPDRGKTNSCRTLQTFWRIARLCSNQISLAAHCPDAPASGIAQNRLRPSRVPHIRNAITADQPPANPGGVM